MVLDAIELFLPYAFFGVSSLWGLTMVVLFSGRLVWEWTDGKVRRAAAALADAETFGRRVEDIPRRTLERVVADTATPRPLAAAIAHRLVERFGTAAYVKRARKAPRFQNPWSPWRRITALYVLYHAGYAGILSVLEEAVRSEDRELAGAAVPLLGHVADVRAARLLVDVLVEGRYPASRVATQLDHFPLPIAEVLMPLLREEDAALRFWGVTLLARYGREHEVAALSGDPDERVRKAVAETLGAMRAQAATPVLLRLLADESWIVRAHAARALGDLKRVDEARGIAKLLADEAWWVRLAARETLFSLGEGVVPVLLPYLEHADGFARNGAAEVLQDLGFVERLVRRALTGSAANGERDDLRRVLEAGGPGMVSSLVLRQDPADAAKLEALLDELGLVSKECG